MLLLNKTVIVTGTARGIGHQMIETFAAQGANVFALARTATAEHRQYCEELTGKYAVKVVPIYFDLTDHEAMKNAVKEIRGYRLDIDGLVNNAGVTHSKLIQMMSASDLRNVMEINFIAPYIFTQYVLKLMLKHKSGSIVNISSMAAMDCGVSKSAYGAAKAALIAMTIGLAEEFGEAGIRANAICPGATNTEMIAYMRETGFDMVKEGNALKRIAEPKDIAGAAAFLLSDLSSYITAQVLQVNGGATTRLRGVSGFYA